MAHFDLIIAFELIAGTGAGILSMLSWEIFRQSPLGRAVFALAVMMSALVIYHAVGVSIGGDLMVMKLLRSLIYTALVAFIGLMIDAQRQMTRDIDTRDGGTERAR